jgi:hypothetical protein
MSGWNLPPGCTTADIDRAMGLDEPCRMCWQFPDDCSCEECPICKEYGNPDCFHGGKGHELNREGFSWLASKSHSMGYSWNGERIWFWPNPEVAIGSRGRRTLWEIEEMLQAQDHEVFVQFYEEEKRLRDEEVEAERISDKWRGR